MEPPTPTLEEQSDQAELGRQIEHLKHQSATVLYLSAINLFANAVTVLIAVLAVLS